MRVVQVTEHTGGRWSRDRGAVSSIHVYDAGDKRCGQTQSGGRGNSRQGMRGASSSSRHAW